MANADKTRSDIYKINRLSLQKDNDGTLDLYESYCTGQLSIESESREVIKTCSGITTDSISKVTGVNVNFSAFMSSEFKRAFYGFENEGLKAGVHAYGPNAKSDEFTVVIEAEDEMEETKVLFAFPKLKNNAGLSISLDNDQTEVAKVNYEGRANLSDKGYFLYTKPIADDADPDVEAWFAGFDETLVEDTGNI